MRSKAEKNHQRLWESTGLSRRSLKQFQFQRNSGLFLFNKDSLPECVKWPPAWKKSLAVWECTPFCILQICKIFIPNRNIYSKTPFGLVVVIFLAVLWWNCLFYVTQFSFCSCWKRLLEQCLNYFNVGTESFWPRWLFRKAGLYKHYIYSLTCIFGVRNPQTALKQSEIADPLLYLLSCLSVCFVPFRSFVLGCTGNTVRCDFCYQ